MAWKLLTRRDFLERLANTLGLALMPLAGCSARSPRDDSPPGQAPPARRDFVPRDVPVGDPDVSYGNIEFTADGRHMVWFEGPRGIRGAGTVWHCAIDPDTGELSPPDGKGFRAFESTVWGRANPGLDADGPYYVGADGDGRMILVRPQGPTSGTRTVLPTPPDPLRRAIYPTRLPERRDGYVFWIRNEKVPGGGLGPRNGWFELQYVDLAEPSRVRIVERQERTRRRGFVPMDIGFARWVQGRPILTYGSADASGHVQIKALDASRPGAEPRWVTDDPFSKVDPFGFELGGREILMAGVDGQARVHIYTRSGDRELFRRAELIEPDRTGLGRARLAQSTEPVVVGGKAYVVYQVNAGDQGNDFYSVAFGSTGEIWMSTLLQAERRQWLISEPSDTIKAEPEPYVGRSRVWVFYNAAPKGSRPTNMVWHLRRAETPLRP